MTFDTYAATVVEVFLVQELYRGNSYTQDSTTAHRLTRGVD